MSNIYHPTKCIMFSAEYALYMALNDPTSLVAFTEGYGLRVVRIITNNDNPNYSYVTVSVVRMLDGKTTYGILQTRMTACLQ